MRSVQHQLGAWALVVGLCVTAIGHAGTAEAHFQVSMQLRPADLRCDWGSLVLHDAFVVCAPSPPPVPTPLRPSTERTLEIWSSVGRPAASPATAAMWGSAIGARPSVQPAHLADIDEAASATAVGACRWGLVQADARAPAGWAMPPTGPLEVGPFLWRCEPLVGDAASEASVSDSAHRAQVGVVTTHLALARSLSQHSRRPSLVVAY